MRDFVPDEAGLDSRQFEEDISLSLAGERLGQYAVPEKDLVDFVNAVTG
jgi:hypothetical protein